MYLVPVEALYEAVWYKSYIIEGAKSDNAGEIVQPKFTWPLSLKVWTYLMNLEYINNKPRN